jgi:hypothetical protein
MNREHLRSWLFTLLLVASVPLSAAGQESPPEEGEKKKLSDVETTEERREGLDRKLDKSLSEFDSLILREQEILEQRRETSAAAGGGGGAGTAAAGAGGAEDGGSESGDEDAAQGKSEGTGGSPDEPSGAEVASDEGAVETTEPETSDVSNGRIPPDVGDGSDDDIVARQLREAAMKEEDPELREKLWDEYRAYKFGDKKKETEG